MSKACSARGCGNRTNTLWFDGLCDRLVGFSTGRAKVGPILEVIGGIAVGGVVALASWRVAVVTCKLAM